MARMVISTVLYIDLHGQDGYINSTQTFMAKMVIYTVLYIDFHGQDGYIYSTVLLDYLHRDSTKL